MNIENDFLTDFDLFGKIPEFYYKGRSKKSSIFGIVLTIIYIIVYIAFLIYKLVRMVNRTDVTFYDSYTFKGLPSIKLTNNEFYGGFGMGGIVDERMYYLEVNYTSKVKVNGQWVTNSTRLQTEICQLEWFGPAYQEIFADQPLSKYYCIRDVSGMVLEGYANLERFSFFEVLYYPCVGKTKDGRDCYDYNTKKKFFEKNVIELKIQDNDLNPTDFKHPVIRRQKDMNSPVFKDLYQLIYSYLQIVNIETDEDITGLNFFTNTIRHEQYTKYENSFLIASPLFFGDILLSGGPIADVTLQLHAKVLTQRRQYTQLIDVLGDVGGLMEILFTFLNIVSSFVTEVLYDKSLVNDLFSFDINKKTVIFNSSKYKKGLNKGDNTTIKDEQKFDLNNQIQDFKELENNKNIEIFSKKNMDEQNINLKNNFSSSRKKLVKRKKTPRNSYFKYSNNALIQYKDQTIPNEKSKNNENKISFEENKKINIINKSNEIPGTANNKNISSDMNLKNVYINNWLVCCFWCVNRKKNVNKVLFEEGSKIITQKLDILNMFNHMYMNEIIEQKLEIEAKEVMMSDICRYNLQVIKRNNLYINNDK